MKLSFSLLLIHSTFFSLAQNRHSLSDTLLYHNVMLGQQTVNGKKVYTANDVVIDSATYRRLNLEFLPGHNPLTRCRPCYRIELDEKEHKLSEGHFYINLPIGLYKTFYPNGKVNVSGFYKNVKPLTDPDFVLGVPCIDQCTVKDSTWKYFSENGKLIRTERYRLGRKLK